MLCARDSVRVVCYGLSKYQLNEVAGQERFRCREKQCKGTKVRKSMGYGVCGELWDVRGQRKVGARA